MSINWVMLHQTQGFVRLPGEKPVWNSSPRVSLAITTPRTYPANSPLNINSSSGTVYLTNQRIVYLPATPTQDFRSFSAPLLNLHDTHVTVPWFGPNAWQAVLQPVPGGNIPSGHSTIELKLTFKEGGAPDFHSNFERIKERLQQALEAARDNNTIPRSGGFAAGVNMNSVHLDQLPTYEASGSDRIASANDRPPPSELHIEQPPSLLDSDVRETGISSPLQQAPNQIGRTGEFEPPTDAPPGYEETQQQSVQEELERRLSNQA